MRQPGHGDPAPKGVSPDEAARRWAAITAQRDRLLRISRARTLNEQDAEDCVQEAMLRCVEFAGLDESRLEQFLTSVTVRLCADTHRARNQRERLGRRLAGPPVEPGPEDDVCDRAEAVWVARQVADLPPRQRAVLAERAAGASYADVARRFGMSGAAVESVLSRARRGVRAALTSTLAWLVAGVRRMRPESGVPAVGAAAAMATIAVVSVSPYAVDRHPRLRRPPVVAVEGVGSAGSDQGLAPATPTPSPTPAPAPSPGRPSASPGPGRSSGSPWLSAGPVTGSWSTSPRTDSPVDWLGKCIQNGPEPGFPSHIACGGEPSP